ncbi:hypothetical protein O0L34_g15191 [Tuta absoluta]|nr:hypothetical protein O0L34_g15191 [Tuta absoluta]
MLSPPAFPVERLVTSSCGSRLCVWGSRGVTVVELPSRWGRGGLFDAGNATVLCKSYSLDERFLYSQGEVRKVQWHPSSLSHLLVLVSDNTIRLYNIAVKTGPKMVKILTIGPKPHSQLAGRDILDSLGDTAVDFTATPDMENLLILRGNGDVYMMQCELDAKTPLQPKLHGPLSMYPPADDNYGTDSCSILALGGMDSPPLVVVATCSAQLYHCLLLPNPTEKEDGDTHALYVVETVELNIVLGPDNVDLQHYYPVHLYPCTNNTYACVHAGGVHTMTLPILRQLKDYSLADEAETETMVSAICSNPSVARHLVCTSTTAQLSPPAGVCISQPPLPRLIVVCDDTTALTSVARHLVCTSTTAQLSPPAGVCISQPPLPRLIVVCDDTTALTSGQTLAMVSVICSDPSIARHLVCTSTTAQLSPPAGVCISQPPLPRLIVVCDDTTALTR